MNLAMQTRSEKRAHERHLREILEAYRAGVFEERMRRVYYSGSSPYCEWCKRPETPLALKLVRTERKNDDVVMIPGACGLDDPRYLWALCKPCKMEFEITRPQWIRKAMA